MYFYYIILHLLLRLTPKAERNVLISHIIHNIIAVNALAIQGTRASGDMVLD